MKKEGVILIGGGGHCRSAIDVLTLGNEYKIKGILDLPYLVGEEILGYKVVGTDDDIPKYVRDVGNFLITIGQIKDNNLRKNAFTLVEQAGGKFVTVISPRAYVSPFAEIGKGTWIGHDVVVNAGAQIGANCILNTKCLIEHESFIGDHTHISTAATVNGQCHIGKDCFVGSGAMIVNNVNIGERCLIGASSLVLNNIEEDMIVTGSRSSRIQKQ